MLSICLDCFEWQLIIRTVGSEFFIRRFCDFLPQFTSGEFSQVSQSKDVYPKHTFAVVAYCGDAILAIFVIGKLVIENMSYGDKSACALG